MIALGLPWKRATVVNLETRAPGSRGKGPGRDALTVQELLALALALDVPPITLLADPHHVREVAISNDVVLNVWDALGWITGAKALDASQPQPAAFANSSALLDQLLVLSLALDELARAPRKSGVRTDDGRLTRNPDEVRAHVEKDERRALEKVRGVLERIAWWGDVAAPDVPEFVYRRAAELGVELPRELREG